MYKTSNDEERASQINGLFDQNAFFDLSYFEILQINPIAFLTNEIGLYVQKLKETEEIILENRIKESSKY